MLIKFEMRKLTMVSSTRRSTASALLLLSIAFCVQAQTTTQKTATGSISGKVTVKGKPAVGVTIMATESDDYQTPRVQKPQRARTDQTGRYRITDLPAGSYTIVPLTPTLVPVQQSESIVLSEGEDVEDVDVQLAPGGVITGRITDAEGEPLTGVQVNLTAVSEKLVRSAQTIVRLHTGNETDDRGIYRAFGLPAGKYKVSVGDSRGGRSWSRQYYKETFFPSVTDAAKATVIEVTEGSETTNVDIMMGRPVGTFKVIGRVIDGDSGKPIPNVSYGVEHSTVDENGGGSSTSSTYGERTSASGEFRVENVTPGKYTIFTVSDSSEMTSGYVAFNVVDRDVTNLVITMGKGGSVSGVVVLDGNQAARPKLNEMQICASVQTRNPGFSNVAQSAIAQDGSFRINGVRSGLASFWFCSGHDQREQFQIVRVERYGVAQAENFQVGEGEQLTGFRVLVKHVKFSGTIRGQVKAESGELPPISRLFLDLWPLDENLQPQPQSSISSPKLDARGHFLAEGLPAGTYRLTISVLSFTSNRATQTTQQVIVADDAITEVTVIIKPEPK